MIRYRCTNSECRSDGAWLAVGEVFTSDGIDSVPEWRGAMYHARGGVQGTLLDPVEGRTNVTRLPTGLSPSAYPAPCGPVRKVVGPARIRLRRKKGWRKPEGAIVVARPSRWGNPFTIESCIDNGFADNAISARRVCVEAFRSWLVEGPQSMWWFDAGKELFIGMRAELSGLAGRDLACWCPLDEPCHGDVLIDLANRVWRDGMLVRPGGWNDESLSIV